MSAEGRVEPCSEAQAKQSGRVEAADDHVDASHRHNEPDRSGTDDGTSGVLEQVQREEARENKKLPHFTVKQRSHAPGTGTCKRKKYLPKSFSRSPKVCTYRHRGRQEEEPRGPGPFYFIGGGNGAEIVSSYCESKGWKRIYSTHRDDFTLKWCQTKSPVNDCNFRAGEQLVYQIPNNKVLTTKIGLLSSLREYERVCCKVKHGQGLRRLQMEEFTPTTFRMDVRAEREAFFAQQEGVSTKDRHMWICKPTGLNQGRGIFLLKNQEDVTAFRQKLQHMEDRRASRKIYHRQPQAFVVQHYIHNPLLLKGRKFDVRSYLLIACTAPYMVFFRHGYVRLTCDLYDPSSSNLSAHLTNQYMQKKNPLYSQLKEDTVWSMESFNAYVNDSFQVAKGLPGDWVMGTFAKRMQQIMAHCFLAVKSKLHSQLGYFDLIGCDFLIDEHFKVWLLEMNCNPALHTNCEVLKEVIPNIVVETLDLTQEIFNKCRLRQKIFPLASQSEFVLLYNEVSLPDSTLAPRKSNKDCDVPQKGNKRTQKAEPRQPKSEYKLNCVVQQRLHLALIHNLMILRKMLCYAQENPCGPPQERWCSVCGL
ncbi:protein polyglycylase TTLL10 isoform X2 [Betta splendens]|uniref:Protein polyglycylase TTLL10 isoform X2 n=1 Tax=Betta splendens TaxID=158456 RepID=A0A6P7N4T5_BETSP|nr:protein polyglycylase TTLL10 isoform X2 [Betta splendens]